MDADVRNGNKFTARRRGPGATQLVVGRVWFGALTPYSLFARAEQPVPSGLASIYNATTPIMTLWGTARASTVTYLAPVVGVVLGALVLSEMVHRYEPVGGLVVIGASW